MSTERNEPETSLPLGVTRARAPRRGVPRAATAPITRPITVPGEPRRHGGTPAWHARARRSMVTLLLRDGDVRAVCDIGSMAAFLDQALRKEAKGVGAQLPERLNLAHGNVFLRVMPALLPEAGLLGLKFFHGSMQDGVRYVVAVCSLDTGEVLGL